MTQIPVAIGASASCTDGVCGQVIRVVVDPVGLTVTHLVIGPKHAHGHHIHRLVPVDLTEITMDGIRLSCTKAEFDKLDPAEETHFEEVWEHPAYEPGQVWCRRRTVTYDSVPIGEVQVRRGEHVHATDGDIGQVEGIVIDPDSRQVTHVLLQEGHLFGRKEVAIPIGAVTRVEAGIRLNLSKRQVEDLPPVAIEHDPLVVMYGRRRTRGRGDLAEPRRESESGQPNPAAGLKGWIQVGSARNTSTGASKSWHDPVGCGRCSVRDVEGLAASVVLIAILLGFLLVVVFGIFCLLHLGKAGAVRFLPKFVWTVLIVCTSPIGGLVYLLAQRLPQRSPEPVTMRTRRSPGRTARYGPAGGEYGDSPASPEGHAAVLVAFVAAVYLAQEGQVLAAVLVVVALALVSIVYLKGTPSGGARERKEFEARRELQARREQRPGTPVH